jgi:hypothetical protein
MIIEGQAETRMNSIGDIIVSKLVEALTDSLDLF